MIYKEGSIGDDVKKIQEIVGVTPDGSFGKKTKEAVVKWQKEHKLTADGIVGPATWKVMFESNKCVDSSVVYNPLSTHITKLVNRPIKYLAIHFTAGSQSKDCVNIIKKVFQDRPASADFAVDDKTMMQYNPDINNYYCWAVGDKKDTSTKGGQLYGVATNKNTISIEVCSSLQKGMPLYSNHDGWYFTEETLNNTVKLTKILMKKFNIPLERVVRHYDISGKLCPGINGWNNGKKYDVNTKKYISEFNNSSEWVKFKEKLK